MAIGNYNEDLDYAGMFQQDLSTLPQWQRDAIQYLQSSGNYTGGGGQTFIGPDGQVWSTLGYDPSQPGTVAPGYEQLIGASQDIPGYGWAAPQALQNQLSTQDAESGRDLVSRALNSGAGLAAITGGLAALGPLGLAGAGALESGDLLGGAAADTLGGEALGGEALGTGAFDISGSAGTGLEYGMQAGPATSSGFMINPGQTASQAAAAAGIGTALPSSGSGLLGSLNSALGTNLTGSDLARIGSGLGQGVLGYLGANEVSNALGDVSRQQAAIGGPYRDLLLSSYQPGFDLMSQPGYGDAFNRAADIATRQWSTRGNPANTPGIQGGILNDIWNQSYLPALSNYRGGLMQAGGMGLNTSGQASLAQAGNAGGTYDALGYGLGTALSRNPLEDYLRNATSQSQSPLTLTIGGNAWR